MEPLKLNEQIEVGISYFNSFDSFYLRKVKIYSI
jgi:hypothetical protein